METRAACAVPQRQKPQTTEENTHTVHERMRLIIACRNFKNEPMYSQSYLQHLNPDDKHVRHVLETTCEINKMTFTGFYNPTDKNNHRRHALANKNLFIVCARHLSCNELFRCCVPSLFLSAQTGAKTHRAPSVLSTQMFFCICTICLSSEQNQPPHPLL